MICITDVGEKRWPGVARYVLCFIYSTRPGSPFHAEHYSRPDVSLRKRSDGTSARYSAVSSHHWLL